MSYGIRSLSIVMDRNYRTVAKSIRLRECGRNTVILEVMSCKMSVVRRRMVDTDKCFRLTGTDGHVKDRGF